jgi:outer membrane protein assembly factor BamB
MKKALVLAFTVVSLSCSLFRPKTAPYPKGLVFPLEESARVSYEGKIVRSAIETAGRIYFSTDKGLLYCLEGASRQVLWTYTGPSPFGCPPALDADSIFIWDQENTFYALDLSGRVLWTKQLQEALSSEIAVDQGHVYIGSSEGILSALDPLSGNILWQFKAGGALEARPVFWGSRIILGCTDGKIYRLDQKGAGRVVFDLGSPVTVAPLIDGDRLYVGTEDFAFRCLDLTSMKAAWKIKAGGKILVAPRSDEKRVFVLSSNSVVCALDKKGGDILWWQIIPARSSYDFGFDGQDILVTTFSSVLLALDRKSGKENGRFDIKFEIKSNPVWLEPSLLVNLHDSSTNTGSLVYLGKQINVNLTSSLTSPQPAGTEVSFNASAMGFYRPRYAYTLRRGEESAVVQTESTRNSWVWFAEKEGQYTIKVKVSDEKQVREAEMPFEIVPKKGETK